MSHHWAATSQSEKNTLGSFTSELQAFGARNLQYKSGSKALWSVTMVTLLVQYRSCYLCLEIISSRLYPPSLSSSLLPSPPPSPENAIRPNLKILKLPWTSWEATFSLSSRTFSVCCRRRKHKRTG